MVEHVRACLSVYVHAHQLLPSKDQTGVSGAGMQIGSEADAVAGEPLNLPVQVSFRPSNKGCLRSPPPRTYGEAESAHCSV